MSKSRIGLVSLTVFLLLSLVAISCAPKQATPVATPLFVLKDNVYLPEGGAESKALKWYADEIFKRTNGRVKIETYYGGALGGIMENLKLTGTGVIEMSGVMTGNHPGELSLSALTTFPFIIKDGYVMGNVLEELYRTYQPFRDEYEKKNNVKLLAGIAGHVGTGNATIPIRTAADFKGKKMRAFGTMNPIATKLGATPVTVPTAQVYEALQKGTVEGDMGQPYAYLVIYKLYEQSNYIFDYGLGMYFNYVAVINLDTWKKMPPDIQKIMEQTAADMREPSLKYIQEADVQATTAMQQKGNQFYRFPQAEIDKIKALAMSVREENIAKLESQGIPAREAAKRIEELAKKYEAKSPLPHPFPK